MSLSTITTTTTTTTTRAIRRATGGARSGNKWLHCTRLNASLNAALVVVCWLTFVSVQLAAAYPSGAPDQACKDMKPGHGAEPASGEPPFELTQDKGQAMADDQIKVTLSSANKTTFKGLLVQALDEKGQPVGKFLAGKGLKLLDSCSAVTHSDREAKKTATLVWQAPAEFKTKQPVSFKATVVHKFDQFYMNIKSTVAAR